MKARVYRDDGNSDAIVQTVLRNLSRTVRASPLQSQNDLYIELRARKILHWLTVSPADTVGITVHKGWVTLSGEVEFAHQQVAAALVLRNLTGVVGIFNHIRIKRAGTIYLPKKMKWV